MKNFTPTFIVAMLAFVIAVIGTTEAFKNKAVIHDNHIECLTAVASLYTSVSDLWRDSYQQGLQIEGAHDENITIRTDGPHAVIIPSDKVTFHGIADDRPDAKGIYDTRGIYLDPDM